MHSIREFWAFYSHFQVTSCQMSSLPVTSGHLSSRDVISCHVTASSCEIQPCRKSNAQYTRAFELLQQLPGNFRSNDVTSGSLPVTWGHVTSFAVTWLPSPASYNPVESQTRGIREFWAFNSHFQLTSGQMTSLLGHFRSPEVTWRHFLLRDCLLLRAAPCRKSNAQYTRVLSLLQPLPGTFGQITSLPGHFRSPKVTWRHFLSRDGLLLRATAW